MSFFLPSGANVDIAIYDLLGRRVERVFGGRLGEGVHRLPFDAGGCAPGLYFLKLRSGTDVRTGKLTVVR